MITTIEANRPKELQKYQLELESKEREKKMELEFKERLEKMRLDLERSQELRLEEQRLQFEMVCLCSPCLLLRS